MGNVMQKVLMIGIGGLLGVTLAIQIIPEITKLTHEETGIVGSMLDMALWIVPISIVVGVILWAVNSLKGK